MRHSKDSENGFLEVVEARSIRCQLDVSDGLLEM